MVVIQLVLLSMVIDFHFFPLVVMTFFVVVEEIVKVFYPLVILIYFYFYSLAMVTFLFVVVISLVILLDFYLLVEVIFL